KGDVHHNQNKLVRKGFRREIARVHSFANFDTRVVAQSEVDLVMAHVNRKNLRRTVLQQTVSKTSGRSAYVETRASRHVDLKLTQRCFEFQPATPDVASGRIVSTFNANC